LLRHYHHPRPGQPRSLNSRPLNPRQERFCLAYAGRSTAAQAARDAGYAAAFAKKQGWRLMRDPRVRARLAGIEAARARDRDDEPAALSAKLEAVYQHALDHGNFHAAARAVELQARLAVAKQTPPPASPPAPDPDDEFDFEDHLRRSAEAEARARARDDAYLAAAAAASDAEGTICGVPGDDPPFS